MEIINFLLTFIFLFMLYYLTTIRKELYTKEKRKRRKPRKYKKPAEVSFLEAKGVNMSSINYSKLIYFLGFIFSFEISLIVSLIYLIDIYIISVIVVLLVLPTSIYITLDLISKYLIKKGE